MLLWPYKERKHKHSQIPHWNHKIMLENSLWKMLYLSVFTHFLSISSRETTAKIPSFLGAKGVLLQRLKFKLTNHSLWPWKPSWFSLFTAMTIPIPGFAAAKEFSSIHPLKTDPKPPSPNTLSGRKFRVAVFSSAKLKLFKFEDCKISPSLRGVGGATEEALLFEVEPLRLFLSMLMDFVLVPVMIEKNSKFNIKGGIQVLANATTSKI